MKIPKDCPETVSKIMTRCWKEDPNERPSFNEIFSEINGLYYQQVRQETSQNVRSNTNHELESNYLAT